MTKDELRELVNFANGAWSRDLFGDPLQRQLSIWWFFLNDLDAAQVKKTLAGMALTEKHLPKPGEVRVRVLEGLLKDPYEAWADAQSYVQALQNGTGGWRALDDTTKEVLKRLGDVAKGMSTNGDREMFVSVFRKVQAELIEANCAPNEPV